jgi:hypothetical protein
MFQGMARGQEKHFTEALNELLRKVGRDEQRQNTIVRLIQNIVIFIESAGKAALNSEEHYHPPPPYGRSLSPSESGDSENHLPLSDGDEAEAQYPNRPSSAVSDASGTTSGPPSPIVGQTDTMFLERLESTIKLLQTKDIPLHKPGEEEYERAVATSNLLYRFSRPHCIAQPKYSFHVQTIIKVANTANIPVTIRNGGHSYAGFSSTNEGIMIDLVKMNRVQLADDLETVTLDGGAQWGHAYKKLINGRHDGLVINGGRCPTVGVSGFLLGGGLGPFTRSFGMGCDTLEEATIVTADGMEVTVKDTDDRGSKEGKLFWALCGAGGGNFGVVVQLKLRVQKLLKESGTVVAGKFVWAPEPGKIDGFMQTMNAFYTKGYVESPH